MSWYYSCNASSETKKTSTGSSTWTREQKIKNKQLVLAMRKAVALSMATVGNGKGAPKNTEFETF
jgi:hypothetical protein